MATRTPRFGLKEHRVFWNAEGRVVCASCHIPYPGSDSWRLEGWKEVTPEDAQEAARHGWRMACEGCGREPSRIVRLDLN